ncbi:T9SS type A sorting domain-containing protein [uncultured Polaribacter sp.]|uniref:T9SS type A sorting domain-containing protein n=1 Tax=uncultured Polaribacter sp. TaxID=174711 RepID=UPI00260394E5|nr:T9SS type A sorting domain-containing protein [uncultured Polaribacter sp.]
MLKKITLMLLFCTSAFIYGQTMVLHDFEIGSPTVRVAGGADYSLIANPDMTDNASANVGRIGRVAGTTNWWLLINFDLGTPYVIPANETRYIHILVKAPEQTDLGVRVDGTAENKNAGGVTRGTNDYTDIGQWQDIVFTIPGGTGGKTVSYLSFHADMGVENVPSGTILNDTNTFLYVDNIKFTNSAPSELQNTWLGTTTDWSTPTNWSRGLPSSSLGAIIPTGVAEPIVADNTAISTNYINIASGTAINISNGSSLLVDKEAISPNNSIKYKRTLTANADATKAWHLATSPIAGVSIVNFIAGNNLASGTTNPIFKGIANYTNDGNGFNYYDASYAGGDAFTVGKGFAIKNATAGDVEFSGFFRKSDRQIAISQGTNNFNLVGNPYLSFINLGAFFTNNNAPDRLTEETIWLWDPNANSGNGGYITKMSGTDPTFEIAPGQAFFVSAGPAADNEVSFAEENQSHKTDTFLKSSVSRTEITLSIKQDNITNSTKLYYLEGTSKGFDNGFDGSMFDGLDYELSIYTIIPNDDKKLSVQSLPNSDLETMIVPLGVIAGEGKEIIFSTYTKNLPAGIDVYLEDREQNTYNKISGSNSHSVYISNALNGTGRFYIHTNTSKSLSLDSDLLNSVSIYNIGSEGLKITGLNKGKTNISLFNLLGKKVMSTTFDGENVNNISLPNLATGIYLVKLQTNKGELNKKIILE